MKTTIPAKMSAFEAGRRRDRAALDMMERTGKPFSECWLAQSNPTETSTPASRAFQRETVCAKLELE